jgi:hypothetical protein
VSSIGGSTSGESHRDYGSDYGSDFDGDDTENDALLSRLRLIEDQPLASRAAAFAQINDELQSRLESGDSSSGN